MSILAFGGGFYYLSKIGVYEYFKNSDTVIEGVLVDKDFQITKLSPILTSNIPIENSITQMIFEPLFKVGADGNIEKVLAESIETSEDKKTINIKLKNNINWSDGVQFTSDDIKSTFEVLKSLKDQNSASVAAQDVTVEVVNTFEVKLQLAKYSPTLYEELSVGILPKHVLEEDNPQNFIFHKINKERPIGTGPYVFSSSDTEGVKLVANKFYRHPLGVQYYFIKFFNNISDLRSAIENSQIHFTTYLPENEIQTEKYSFLKYEYSNPLEKRYWALYFNLQVDENLSETDKKYRSLVQNQNIRKAIMLSIDREKLITLVGKNVVPMYSFLPEKSQVYSSREKPKYDYQKAAEILEKDGWVVSAYTDSKAVSKMVRMKNGNPLIIRIAYLDTPEKRELITEIENQLKVVNISLESTPYSASDLVNSVIKGKRFDMLLYGVEAYLDSDRIRLWHSSQISENGLNFSSYKSSSVIKDPISGKEIPKSDDLLVRGRVELNAEERKKIYLTLSNMIDDVVPAIFLYQPTTGIVYNKRLKNIDIQHITTPSDIYSKVFTWEVE